MLFRLRIAAYACIACVLIVTHFLAAVRLHGVGGNLSSVLYAAPGIAAFILLSIVIHRVTPTGVSTAGRVAQRMKGLHCLYQVSAVMAREQGLVETLQQVVDLIPPAMQYPGSAQARITCAGMNFNTSGFVETEWGISSEIKVGGRPVGSLQACYAAERPETERGPFLEYEELLIKALAAEAGAFIEQYQAAESPRLRQRV